MPMCLPARIRLQLVDKAVSREKERIRSDEKKAKRRAKAFLDYLLHDIEPALRASDTWEKVRPRYSTRAAVYLYTCCSAYSHALHVYFCGSIYMWRSSVWRRRIFFCFLPAGACVIVMVNCRKCVPAKMVLCCCPLQGACATRERRRVQGHLYGGDAQEDIRGRDRRSQHP